MKLDFDPDPYGVAAHAVYAASAGSGKTHQLTNRYLRLLLAGVRVEALGQQDNPFAPERILATTFTKKAAGEIRARVIQRLLDTPKLVKTLAQVEQDKPSPTHLTDQEVKRMLRLLANRMHRLRIGTLDAFVGSLAAVLAPELGITGEALVIEEQWALAAKVRESAIEHALEQLGDKAGEATLHALHDGFHGGAALGKVLAPLSSTVAQLLALYRENPEARWGIPPAWCQSAPLSDAEVERLADNLRLWSQEDWKHASINKALEKDANLVGTPDWARQVDTAAGIWGKVRQGENMMYKKPLSLDLINAYERLIGHVDALEFERLSTMFAARKAFLGVYDAGERAVRRRLSVSYYSDALEQLAQLPEIFKPELYERLDGQLDHLLFDEFQDTSRAQWHLFEPLVSELRAGSERERSTLVVGDPKQAIYGWRGGCVDLFHAAQVGVSTYPLAVSYRSSPAIMQTVNRVFVGIADNPALMHDKLDGAPLRAAWSEFQPHQAANADMPGAACLVTLGLAPTASGDEDDNEEGDGSYAGAVANYVAYTLSAHDFNSAGVLVRGNAMGQALLLALRKVAPADWSVEGEKGCLIADHPAVAPCLAWLRLADNPDDLIAAAQVAASPLEKNRDRQEAGVNQDSTPAPLRSRFFHASPWLNLDSLKACAAQTSAQAHSQLTQTGLLATLAGLRIRLLPSCNASAEAALDHLLVLAADFEQNDRLRTGGAARFLSFVADQALPGGVMQQGKKTLRVMTLHKSKGLEFDAVFMPDLHGKLQGSKNPTALVRRATPAAAPSAVLPYLKEAQVAAFGPQAKQLADSAFTAQVQESLCLLYVGMTRAQRFLALLVPPIRETKSGLSKVGRDDLSPAALLRHALGAPMDAPEENKGEQSLWQTKHGTLPAKPPTAPAPQAPAAAPPPARAPIVFGNQKQKRGFTFASPSAGAHFQEAGASATVDTAASDHAKTLGTLVHAYFEHVGFVDQSPAPDLAILAALQTRAQVAPTLLEEAKRVIAAALAAPAVHAALSRRGAATLHVEQPMLGRNAEGKPVFGIADRVVIWEENGRATRAEILDYKTDTLAGPDSAAQARQRHGSQLNAYRALLAEALSVPANRVKAQLVLVRSGEVVEIQDGPLGY